MIGAFAFVGSGWFLGDAARVLSTAIGLLLVLVLFPSGVAGAVAALRNRVLRRVTGEAAPPASAPLAPPSAPPAPSRRAEDGPVPALRVRGLRACIGERVIVDDISFDVAPGGALALLGTNGAGKSTVLNAISGLVPVTGGSIELDGVDITNRPAHRIAALGVVQAPGGRGVFPSLTVAENLDLAGWAHPRGDAGVRRRIEAALDAFPSLRARFHEHAADLSGGEQQMLVLAMASVARPAVMLIDELSLGLAPIVVGRLVGFVEQVRAAGTTVVVVEQSVRAAQALTEAAVFLEHGRVRVHRHDRRPARPPRPRPLGLPGGGDPDRRPRPPGPPSPVGRTSPWQRAGSRSATAAWTPSPTWTSRWPGARPSGSSGPTGRARARSSTP